MTLQFTKPTRIDLKKHSDFSEKWVQDQIIKDPTILGLGDLEVLKSEKVQSKAGRLDLLLYDDQLNRRYEVELMLGATDPSHIMRCIEYWDIEKRRYPAYDHVAVLVAEDITSRFLNVMSLLAGSIPLIAIQLVALQVDDKILLHCVQVLDQTELRTDDEHDDGGGGSGVVETDRAYWEKRTSPAAMQLCDRLAETIDGITGEKHHLVYRRRVVNVTSGKGDDRVWLLPRKTVVRVGGYVSDPELWVKKFDDFGQNATLKRGNKAALISFNAQELEERDTELREFLTEVYGSRD